MGCVKTDAGKRASSYTHIKVIQRPSILITGGKKPKNLFYFSLSSSSLISVPMLFKLSDSSQMSVSVGARQETQSGWGSSTKTRTTTGKVLWSGLYYFSSDSAKVLSDEQSISVEICCLRPLRVLSDKVFPS